MFVLYHRKKRKFYTGKSHKAVANVSGFSVDYLKKRYYSKKPYIDDNMIYDYSIHGSDTRGGLKPGSMWTKK